MSGQFEFSFEELPLLTDLGFDAGLVNGVATITFHQDGEWSISEIALDGHRERTKEERAAASERIGRQANRFECRPVVVDRAERQWLYLAIHEQLENGRFKDQIVDQVDRELGESGIARRDPDREHSTLNHAQQGI